MYTILACITFVLDVVSFFAIYATLASFNSDSADGALQEIEDAYLTGGTPYVGRILVVMLYTTCDIVFLLWIIHFRSRLGPAERGYVHKALLGYGYNMRIAFGKNPNEGKGQAAQPGGKP